MNPPDQTSRPLSVAETLRTRRSIRRYDACEVDLARLLQLLWAGQGITDGDGKRTTPSAHALYPLSLFVLSARVDGLATGLHRYDPGTNALSQLSTGDLRAGICAAALEQQSWLEEAPALIVIAADMARAIEAFAAQPPTGRRGMRYVYLEAGAVMQNICLQATTLGLATVFVGGFDDAEMAGVLKLPPPFEPVGLICVGWPAD